MVFQPSCVSLGASDGALGHHHEIGHQPQPSGKSLLCLVSHMPLQWCSNLLSHATLNCAEVAVHIVLQAGAVSSLSMDRLCFAPAISELSNATGLITQQPSLGVENALVGSAAHRSGLPSSRQHFCLA